MTQVTIEDQWEVFRLVPKSPTLDYLEVLFCNLFQNTCHVVVTCL